MSRCFVCLEDYQNSNVSGQKITGQVICIFQKDTPVNCIYVCLTGSSTYFTKRDGKNGMKSVDGQKLDQQRVDFVSKKSDLVLMASGVYKFPFIFTLSNEVPSTVTDGLRQINCNIKAVVDRPCFKFNYKSECDYVFCSALHDNDKDIVPNEDILSKGDEDQETLDFVPLEEISGTTSINKP